LSESECGSSGSQQGSQVDDEAKIFKKTTANLRLLTAHPQLLRQTSGYHERLLRLIRGGGILAYDNTL